MQKCKIGFTVGDLNGVGIEVILKSLQDSRIFNKIIPVIYGSNQLIAHNRNVNNIGEFNFNGVSDVSQIKENEINVVNCWQDTLTINFGEPDNFLAKFAKISIDQALNDIKQNKLDAIVTGPINKAVMSEIDFNTGHTEYITKEMEGQSLMMMVNEDLRVSVATTHIPINEVAEKITSELLQEKINIFLGSLIKDFGISKPKLAVLGLNPHAGEGGAYGSEDVEIIRPLISKYQDQGHFVFGPFSADGFFGAFEHKKYDGILAMYHDQGLIPFKTLSFGSGVNYTAGLNIIRTSPDHGTAFGIAGKGKADFNSMQQAIFMATKLHANRLNYVPPKKSITSFLESEGSAG